MAGNGVGSEKYFLAADIKTKGAGAKRLFAHRRFCSSGRAEKQSSKRSAFSALSFSRFVFVLRENCRFDSVVVNSAVGAGVDAEMWRAFLRSFRTGKDGGSGMIREFTFGAEAGAGWSR